MIRALALVAFAVTVVAVGAFAIQADDKPQQGALGFKMKDIDGKEVDLSSFKGKVLLIVNVASKCGLTDGQYKALTALHEKYKGKGFEILAFPANNFGKQEPGSDQDIKEFCSNRKVAFKLFSKISVKGDDIHPLYKFLTGKDTNPKFAGEIRWNFDKFLLDSSGNIIGRFEPKADPLGKDLTEALDKALAAKGNSK